MKIQSFIVCAVLAPSVISVPAYAFDVVEAGQPVVTGEPSRVGPPWNHRSTFNIPGTQTDIAFGGYVKLDAFYDFDYDLGNATNPYAVMNPDNRTDGRTSFTAYESRLNFRTHTQTDYGRLSTFFEGHFIPDGSFGVRHAYGELNGFLAGRTWSNFMSFVGGTRTLALGDPKGYAFDRQAQLRYTQPVGDSVFSVALENPTTVLARTDAPEASGESQLPDLTLRYEYKRLFALSGVVRQLSTNDINRAVDDKATGYGVQAQLSLPLGAATSLQSSVTYGEGIGNYMGNPGNTGHRNAPDIYVDGNDIKAVETRAFGLALNHHWTRDWFSSVGVSHLEQDLPLRYGDHFETINYGFANVIWDVTERMSVGLEYQRAEVEQVNGVNNDANRLQASATFQF